LSPGTVPLGVLLRREVTKERMERPDVLCGEASRSRKGEDFTLLRAGAGQRVAGDPSTSFSVFAVPPDIALPSSLPSSCSDRVQEVRDRGRQRPPPPSLELCVVLDMQRRALPACTCLALRACFSPFPICNWHGCSNFLGQERKSCWRFFSFLNGEQCMLRPSSCIRNVENFVRPGDCGSWLMSLPMLAYLYFCAVMSGRTLPGSRWVVNSCR